MDIHQRFAALGCAVPEILLPKPGVDLSKWAVIACDQFSQDHDFWAKIEAETKGGPSSLRLIYPEIYLEDKGRREQIAGIHQAMEDYLRGGVFAPPFQGFVYLERTTPYHPLRRGLVMAIDLERYNWSPDTKPLIRATEGTVKERLPPRMEIRRGAPLEIPHILLLIDDEHNAVLPELGRRAKARSALYRTELRPDAGSLTGWSLDERGDWDFFAGALEALAERAKTRYGAEDPIPTGRYTEPFLFAVGDGNHSLATAKAIWEEYKQNHREWRTANHPARWALVELENLYDPGIRFEPIHHLLFGVQLREILSLLAVLPGFSCKTISSGDELARLVEDHGALKNRLGLIAGNEFVLTETDEPGLSTSYLQPLLDAFIRERNAAAGMDSVTIDYIHGKAELFKFAGEKTGGPPVVGVLLPPVKKSGLFETVARTGPLPRKSFSLGEGIEKRFYLESRRLF
ncbi:MAG: DUF1015 domain-containing protein [Treponema sp.]|jgi:hypothetical protein|nr:DUF1015 domain-containing protein [Treponema sp.]